MAKNKPSTLTIKAALRIKIWENLATAQNHTLTSIHNNGQDDIITDTDNLEAIEKHIESARAHLQDLKTNHTH